MSKWTSKTDAQKIDLGRLLGLSWLLLGCLWCPPGLHLGVPNPPPRGNPQILFSIKLTKRAQEGFRTSPEPFFKNFRRFWDRFSTNFHQFLDAFGNYKRQFQARFRNLSLSHFRLSSFSVCSPSLPFLPLFPLKPV